MPDTYYYSGQSGDSFVEAELHHSDDCEELLDADGGTRPVSAASVDRDSATFCSECMPWGNGSADAGDGSPTNDTTRGTSELIDDGECPWCTDYEGDHVGMHASSAHPEAWDEYSG